MEKISDRLRFAIENLIESKGRTQTLEDLTEISSETWRKFLNGKQRATLGMLEALTTRWPEYAFWISTGINDSDFGHRSPKGTGFPRESKIQESSVHYLVAVSAWNVENEKFAKIWLEDETNELSQKIHDTTKRNKHHLETNNEQVNKNQITVSLLDDLRWIEILIDVYLPKFGYEDTERMLQLAKNKLEQIEKNAKRNEIEIKNESIKSKIHDLDIQIARHHEWKTRHETLLSTNAKI
ncbi:hypothetical protein [Undibacterium macrobrachii]|uniref:HTH cro/C1-type domain-containing protein n=1 Tax=Undibacterium macrobrachii TaxID=1119058 RepID=A0ABQ2XEV9_9BURK|nr:hypothetical protein [Undibacterium macrobrachii]GGX14135.1 hypothetical protein GCM10011282_20320 [Undibacterium macrobrachii]